MRIRLIGCPAIFDAEGNEQVLRGHQAWVLLARIILSKRSLGRGQLAAELFPEVADPLGALRWCLGSIRKAMGNSGSLRGDPTHLGLPEGTFIDVLRLEDPDFVNDDPGELLEGIEPRCSLELTTWLLIERERVASLIETLIREKTLRALSKGDHRLAIRTAELGARRRPFDEGAHILLVKSLTEAGRHQAASDHIDNVERVFEAELGEKPSAALWSAARKTIAAPPSGVRPAAAVKSLMDSGRGALAAGAIDAGIDCLRRAVASAEKLGDCHLHAIAALELGTALVHSIRGYDDEGTIMLRQAAALSEECGAQDIVAKAYGELGYVEALTGRRPTAAKILDRALSLASDAETTSAVHAVIGFNLVDWGNLEEGLKHYEAALENARSANSRRREIWALGLGSWGLLAAGRYVEAEAWLNACLERIEVGGWISFRPWPLAVLAEVKLRQQIDPKSLREGLEDGFALSCQMADPCWEAASARVMALTYIATDEVLHANRWLDEARTRCLRETDRYAALFVTIVADQASLSARRGQALQAELFARELLQVATRAHMPGYVSLARTLINH